MPVLESYDRGDKGACCLSAAKRNEPTFKSYQRTVGEDAIRLRPGDTIDLDPLVTITAVASGGLVVGETGITNASDENDMSVALLINFGGFKAFFGGDIHAHTEGKIAARDLVLDVDVYKGDHHGSHTSSSSAFMLDARPTVVVISNGSHGGHLHPRRVTLDAYRAMIPAPAVFQTNECLQPAPCDNFPDARIADPESVDDDGTILITVDATTSNYTLTYGTSKQTFPIKAPTPPTGVTPTVVISAVLPNPAGDDGQNR